MTIQLIRNIDKPRSRNLVFTSSGDYANVHLWLKGHRNFDLWVSHYGDRECRYKDSCDFYMAKKGAKWPALHYVYQNWKDLVDHYDAVFALDDDIIFDGSSISRLFEIREKYDLWVLQPAFDPRGKIAHPTMQVKPFSFMRYTNFVENGCALFRKDKLDSFMDVYDPILVGWGIDLWYSEYLGLGDRENSSVVDDIPCINPIDISKGSGREIDLLQDRAIRIKNWERIVKQHNLKSNKREIVVYKSIKNPLTLKSLIKGISAWLIQARYASKNFIFNNNLLRRIKNAGHKALI